MRTRLLFLLTAQCFTLACAPAAKNIPPVTALGLNEEFRQVSEREPTFGGLYMNEAQHLVLLGTKPSAEASVRLAVAPMLLERHLENTPTLFETCRWSWLELLRAGETVLSRCAAIQGFRLLDLDERFNRVVAGASAAQQEALAACVRGLQLEEGIVIVVEAPEIEQR